MPHSEVQALLEDDDTRTHRSYLLLRALRPSAPECFDLAARTFTTMHAAFGASSFDQEQGEVLKGAAQNLGINLRELNRRIQSEPDSPIVNNARIADRQLRARQSQKFAFQLAWRAYRWAATDLRRFRVSAVYGFQRQQAEAIGLIAIFRDEPEIAIRWFLPTLNTRRLFSQIQPKVKARLDDFDLRWAYDHGSAASMHSTFASGAAGTRLSAEGEHHLTVKILDDEVNEADPYLFHLAAGGCLRTQQRVFKAVTAICPDIVTQVLSAEVEAFASAVEDIWWTLKRRYGDRIARMERGLQVRKR